MSDEDKIRERPVDELMGSQEHVAELEEVKAECGQSEQEIADLRFFYERVLDGLADGVWMTDKNDVIHYTNAGMEVIAGVSQEQIVGTRILEDFPESTLKFFRPHFLKAKETLQPIYYEAVPQITPAGRLSYQSGWLIPLIDDGHYDGMICTVVDITEIKLTEEKLRKRITYLEDLVKKLSGNLEKAEMDIQRDMAERKRMEEKLMKAQKLESVGVIVGGIAHDFNNMLTTILGNMSLARIYIQAEDAEEKALERLSDAEEASMLANALTQRLLAFSRFREPVKKVLSIAELLNGTVSFALSGSNAKCNFSIPDDLWKVRVDEGQITQSINNLIINSIQAMPEGGAISVCAENVTLVLEDNLPLRDGQYVKISIADQGAGVPEEHLEKIFEPFFTTKRKGNGLGLTDSYSIIEKHNGHIVAESQLGVGTTFYIYLPAAQEEVLTKNLTKKMEGGKELKTAPAAGKGRIMVMDDDESIRDFLSEMLSSIGYEVTTATDGANAIELYRVSKDSGQTYDAVIVDLTIPGGIGGRETIRKLLEIDPEVKAIVSSGYSDDPILADFRKHGFKGFIAKPYKIEEMSAVLHEMITARN